MLPKCLSNVKYIRTFLHPILRFRDFARSHDKTAYRMLKRGPGYLPSVVTVTAYTDFRAMRLSTYLFDCHHAAWNRGYSYLFMPQSGLIIFFKDPCLAYSESLTLKGSSYKFILVASRRPIFAVQIIILYHCRKLFKLQYWYRHQGCPRPKCEASLLSDVSNGRASKTPLFCYSHANTGTVARAMFT